MPQKRRSLQVPIYDQINLTNLIDTLFFLLIIFMITAPLLEYSVDVTPPEMNADPIKPDSDSEVINIKADGTTGGMAQMMAEESGVIDHVDGLLTLKGLRLIWERNH